MTAENIPATVDIADVVTDVEFVHPELLEPGDILFDTFGRELPIVKVTRHKHVTRTKRADGVWDSWHHIDGGVTRKKRA